jgi:hypothetical protein
VQTYKAVEGHFVAGLGRHDQLDDLALPGALYGHSNVSPASRTQRYQRALGRWHQNLEARGNFLLIVAADTLIAPVVGQPGGDACYNPFTILDENNGRWMLWYNGRKERVEQIGLAILTGYSLGLRQTHPSCWVLGPKMRVA